MNAQYLCMFTYSICTWAHWVTMCTHNVFTQAMSICMQYLHICIQCIHACTLCFHICTRLQCLHMQNSPCITASAWMHTISQCLHAYSHVCCGMLVLRQHFPGMRVEQAAVTDVAWVLTGCPLAGQAGNEGISVSSPHLIPNMAS
jgi:hypothetical protein